MEIVLPRRALPQPHPYVSDREGDCAACCLAGLTGLDVSEVYRQLLPNSTTIRDLSQALYEGKAKGLFDRVITHSPLWVGQCGSQTWGLPSWEQASNWWEYVVMGLDAGYYGLCVVDVYEQGPFSRTNHVVLVVGARERSEEGKSRVYQDVLSSCSASGGTEEWVEVSEFLQRRGGFPVLLARPTK